MIKRIFLFVMCALLWSTSRAQSAFVDSIKQVLETAKLDTNKVLSLLNVADSYVYTTPDSAIHYGMESLRLAKTLNWLVGEIESSGILAQAFCMKGSYHPALEISLKYMQAAENSGDNRLIQTARIYLSATYFYMGDYEQALIGFMALKDNAFLPPRYENGFLGETYFHLNRFDSAKYYMSKAYDVNLADSAFRWSIPFTYMAAIQGREGRYDEAFRNYHQGIRVSKQNNVNADAIKATNWMAALYRKTGQLDSAIKYAKQAIDIAIRESMTQYIMDAAGILTECYAGQNADSAFKYQRILLASKDSLFSEGKVKQLQSLLLSETMRKQEAEFKDKQIANRMKIYGLVGAVVLFMVITFFLFRNNKFKQRANALLEQRNLELKSTQQQLIQSEKMASLGELTAGIAHEIQNPLNFINNFAEVSSELATELNQELNAGNIEEVKLISADLNENMQKIAFHGKRADSIVKNMLRHSRQKPAQKEPTDINLLVDEYLRLSYQGLRAKDKSFNANMQTELSPDIGKVSVVAQEISRVLLNLFNNAFYSVHQKKLMLDGSYDPLVYAATLPEGNAVKIIVRDNGMGIPKPLLEKIYQPFFTTKPTGEGTGLGLSMSYEIITNVHNGILQVNTVEKEYAEFIITLPIQ